MHIVVFAHANYHDAVCVCVCVCVRAFMQDASTAFLT